jgi:Flp pilus assembly pilin Flp
MKANRFKRDESGATNVDTILILGLFLAIVLVLIYVGTSVFNWSDVITEPLSDYVEAWQKGLENLKAHLGMATEFQVDDALLKSMYEDDSYIMTANETVSEYLTTLKEVTNRSHIYNVDAFTGIKATNESTTTTERIFGVNVIERVFGWTTQEQNRIIIPDDLMTRINSLNEGAQIHIYSESYDAYITSMGLIGTDAHYMLTIATKG